MDDLSHSLVPLEQEPLVPVSAALGVDPDNTTTDPPHLWQFFWLLFWVALLTIDQLRRQLLELRYQSHYWRAQNQTPPQPQTPFAPPVPHTQDKNHPPKPHPSPPQPPTT